MSGWVRFENTTPDNLKVIPVSDRAFRLWFNAGCFCSRGETDGRIPKDHMRTLIRSGAAKAIGELVDAGLLEVNGTNYIIHDYLEYNPSRARIEEMKENVRKRVTKHRAKRVTNASPDDAVTRDVTRNPRGRDRPVPGRVVDVDVSPHREVSNERYYSLCEKLAEQIRAVDPDAKVQPTSKRWLDSARLLLEQDKREFELVVKVLDWLPTDDFWPSVILSMPKFREKFTQLLARSQRSTLATAIDRAAPLRRADAWQDAPEYQKGNA